MHIMYIILLLYNAYNIYIYIHMYIYIYVHRNIKTRLAIIENSGLNVLTLATLFSFHSLKISVINLLQQKAQYSPFYT